MINSIKKLVLTIAIFIIMSISVAFAGTARIEFADLKNVTRGSSVDLTLKVKSNDNTKLQNADITFTYDINKLEYTGPGNGTEAEGGAGQIRVTGKGSGSSSKVLEYHIKFNTLQAGETNTNVLNFEVYDNNNDLVNITKTGSSTIIIKAANKTSKNANLKSLSITPGELDKSFDPAVLDYNTEVNADCLKLVIDAPPEDSDATVKITGNDNFQVGNNRVTISVVAANNITTKNYNIIVNKLDTGTTMGQTEVIDGIKLIGREYRVTTMPIPEDQMLEGYKLGQANINNNNIEVLVANNAVGTPETFLCYGISDKQEVGWFRYDNVDGTIQRYFEDSSVQEIQNVKLEYTNLAEKYKNLVPRYNLLFKITVGVAVLALILFIALLVNLLKSNKNNNNRFYEDDEDDEDDDFYTSRTSSLKNKRINEDEDEDDDYNKNVRPRANIDEEIEDLD